MSPSLDALLLKGAGTLCPGEAHLQSVSRLTPHWPQGPWLCTLAPLGTEGPSMQSSTTELGHANRTLREALCGGRARQGPSVGGL